MTPVYAALAGQPLLVVLALLLTALLIVAMGAVTWSYDLRRARLPLATRVDGLEQQLVTLTGQLNQKQAELDNIKRQIQERDHIGAEIAVLREQLDGLRLELSGLDEGRRQIEELKRKAAETATEYAEISGKLDEARRMLADAEEWRARLKALQEEVARLQVELEAGRAERGELGKELDALREERDKVQTELGVARELVGKVDVLRQEIERLQRHREQADAAAAEAERHRAAVTDQLDTLRAERAQLLAERRKAMELAAENVAADLKGGNIGPDREAVGLDEALSDLRLVPSCLSALPEADWPAELETDALDAVFLRLDDLGLRYSRRAVRAFHTALKINETAQMTVLAGVSGTGKSLLPRRYAEAMGIAFLQIAVEPRWDSPQDLLGFYNYVEKRYRATELARALVQMDPFNSSRLADTPLGERMLLVLLDEMNLARVEYYFSEFLSRLEVRPPYAEATNAARRRDASMPIDIRGRKEGLISLFPSHNVLFAGTMNDDESTQALSDKVLDRGNVMQFAAPLTFAPNITAKVLQPPGGFRRFSAWRSWVKPVGSLSNADRTKTDEIIRRLARIMEQFGRPFGHRLNEAILAYAANYPRRAAESLNEPLADQIEFRILSKLRGVPIEETRAEFDDLGKLIREELRDDAFADRLAELVDRQGRGSGQFNWRGLDRG